MKRLTLLGLVLVFLVLALVWRRERRAIEDGTRFETDRTLFEDFRPEAIVAVRVDNRERASHVKLERDARGAWFLTDPIAYPARVDVVRSILQTMSRARGEPLDAQVDPASLGLAPPGIVLELTQSGAAEPRILRCEVGDVDVDPRLVHVRVLEVGAPDDEPVVLRAPRPIRTTLDRNPDDYRETRIVPLDAARVTSLRRGGELDGVELDALMEPDGWRVGHGPTRALDPAAIGLLVRAAAELRAQRFIADHPDSIAEYGLEPPALRLELMDENGRVEAVRFGSPEAARGRWFALREGLRSVFEVQPGDVTLLARPIETLYDLMIVRALRERIVAIELTRAGEVLAVERDPEGWWLVLHAADEPPGDAPRFAAAAAGVEDLLARLEQARIGGYLPDVPFEGAEQELAFTVRTVDGARWGGRIGAPWRDADHGAAGRLFLRHGDEVTSSVEESLVELVRTPLDALRRTVLHALPERLVQRIELRHRERTLTYVRAETQWYPLGVNLPAPREFTGILDGLLNLRAEEWLDADGAPAAIEERVGVVLKGAFGDPRRFELARDALGRTVAIGEGGARARVSEDLLGSALSLFSTD